MKNVKKFEVLKGGKAPRTHFESRKPSGKNADSERYPVELPGRNGAAEISPIVDVVETETFPKKV